MVVFIKQIDALSLVKKKEYDKAYQDLKLKRTFYELYIYIYLSFDYPISPLLFLAQQEAENIKRDSMSQRNLAIDDPETVYLTFEEHANIYNVIIEMLKHQKSMSVDDRYILKLSKQRFKCINNMLKEIEKSKVEVIKVQRLIDRCFL